VLVRDDWKKKIKASGGDQREAACFCGVSYQRLNSMLNGFTLLKPEVERDLLAYINEKRRAAQNEN
jgi:hypothetical protein